MRVSCSIKERVKMQLHSCNDIMGICTQWERCWRVGRDGVIVVGRLVTLHCTGFSSAMKRVIDKR